MFAHPHDETGRPVGDGSQGVHYPVGDDGGPDFTRPLFWDAEAASYRDKTDADPSHFEAYHQNHVDIIPEGGGEPITVTDEEADAIRKMLEERRKAGE